MPTLYSFDASSLLNGRRDLLPPEVFTSLWANIEELIVSGDIRCVDVVRDELERKDDAVAAWARSLTDPFVTLEAGVQTATRDVLAAHPRLTGTGGGRNAADSFVIGFARTIGGTVVTEETRSGNLTRPRIPDVCEALDIPWMNLINFVRAQGWSY